ncbi:MAG: hypothetical protein HYY34_01860 [Chloroflexi bacterium]|nr:hypothetical protein [Chloroflexota bacterium]
MLSAEELLAGSTLAFEVEVPEEVLRPGADGQIAHAPGRKVRLRPLTVADLQTISRAAKESDSLVATLIVQQALCEPEMSVAQVSAMHVGLMQFLLNEVTRISGMTATAEQVASAANAPLAKAAFVLAREFGWTPEQVNGLTLGQVLLHLELLRGKSRQ